MRRLALLFILLASMSAQAGEVLPFIENDYAAAIARARAKNIPLFVEAWAPW